MGVGRTGGDTGVDSSSLAIFEGGNPGPEGIATCYSGDRFRPGREQTYR
jgi:hypothetical protein